MRTIKSLIRELQKFPDDALVYAYEGEVCAVVIQVGGKGVAWISCDQLPALETEPACIPGSSDA